MKKFYLILTIIGFIAPNIFVTIESLETGNVLLWLDPTATINGMFANRISSAFVIDLLVVVFVFFFWTYHEAKRYQIKKIWDCLGTDHAFWNGRYFAVVFIPKRKKYE